MTFDQFVDYVYSFYGKGGIYPIANLTHDDIIQATLELQSIPNREFCADSIDRERVRDIIMSKLTVV